jgi:hypothetical protein
MALTFATLNITLDGTTQRVTTDTTIWSPMIRFELDDSAVGTAHTGNSALAGASTAFDSLIAGEVAEYNAGVQGGAWGAGGEMFRLSDFYVKGTTGDIVHVIYLTRTLP